MYGGGLFYKMALYWALFIGKRAIDREFRVCEIAVAMRCDDK